MQIDKENTHGKRGSKIFAYNVIFKLVKPMISGKVTINNKIIQEDDYYKIIIHK